MATERQSTGSSPLVDIMREVYDTKIRLKRVIQSVLETDSDDFEEYVTLTHNAIVHEYNRGYIQGYNEGYHVIFPTAQLTEDDYGHGLRDYDVFVPSIPEYSTDTFIDNLVAIMKDSYRIRLLIKAALNTSSDEFVTYPDILEELLAAAYDEGYDNGYSDGGDDATAVEPPISDLGTPVIHYTQGESYVTITANGASGTMLYWWSSLDNTKQLYTGQIVIRESQTIFAANFAGDNRGPVASKYCDMSNGEEAEGLAAPRISQDKNNISIFNRDNHLGGTIWYSFDNSNWRQYTGTITITEDTTIYAYYSYNNATSDVVSKYCEYSDDSISDYLTIQLAHEGDIKITPANSTNVVQPSSIEYRINGGAWQSGLFVSKTLKNVSLLQIRNIEFGRTASALDREISLISTSEEHTIYGDISTLFVETNELHPEEIVYAQLFINDTTLVSAYDLKLDNVEPVNNIFKRMFEGCTSLTTAPKTIHSSIGLKLYCCESMFEGCTSLVNAPTLPATGINYRGYMFMFKGCTSLVNAPALPATRLSMQCYMGMFEDCTSLVNVNAFPRPTLIGEECCRGMFSGCTSLVNAPALPATTVTVGSYMEMFRGCTSLVNAPTLPATTLGDNCYVRMFRGCTSLVNAPELPATELKFGCYSGMFSDCTSLVNAPALPATTLARSCYSGMFSDCISLINAPALPATTLDRDCYFGMFKNCTSLVNAPELPATRLSMQCYWTMFEGCTSLVNAPALPATTLAESCYVYMFKGCTSLVNAPEELPATTLADSCYKYMFIGCTSLVNAPELPANTLVAYCYQGMFANCRNLNYVKCTARRISAQSCITVWLDNVSSTGTFVKKSGITWPTGNSGIPTGWTVQEVA